MVSLDVIIPTKNSGDIIRECLTALRSQTVGVNIIVVDAHSTDETVHIATECGAAVIPEPPSDVRGSRRAVACNEGLRHSTSALVGFVDSDTIVPERWAEDLVPYILNDSTVGSVTSGCVSLDTTPLSRAISRVIKFGSTHARNFEEIIKINSSPGYNSIYLREAIDRVGGFSEEIGGCEDWELNYRIRKAGWDVVGVPESPVEHRERRSLKSFAKQMRGYGWSRGRLLRVKHIFTPLHILPSLALLGLLILPLVSLLATLFLILGALIFVLLFLLVVDTGAKNATRETLLILVVFATQQLSWAVGYVVGLLSI